MLAGDRRRARKSRGPAHGSDDIDDENDGKLRELARLPWRLRTFPHCAVTIGSLRRGSTAAANPVGPSQASTEARAASVADAAGAMSAPGEPKEDEPKEGDPAVPEVDAPVIAGTRATGKRSHSDANASGA